MVTIFRYAMRRSRGQVLGWGIGMALLGWMMVSVYDSLAGQEEALIDLVSVYPKELMAFFGSAEGMTSMFTPEGFLSLEFLSLAPVILGIYSVLMGSGLLVSDEEKGTLDLILAHPVTRTSLLGGRACAFAAATAGILAIIWLGFMAAMTRSSMEIGGLELLRPLLSLFAVLLLFGALALFLSMLLPSRRLAATVSGLLLVASYFVTSLARINENLEQIARFSPLNYYQSEKAFQHFNVQWLSGLLGVALLFVAVAWWSFQRRDIRVGGEGGWQVPKLVRRWRAARTQG